MSKIIQIILSDSTIYTANNPDREPEYSIKAEILKLSDCGKYFIYKNESFPVSKLQKIQNDFTLSGYFPPAKCYIAIYTKQVVWS